jgi:hypothetical protein
MDSKQQTEGTKMKRTSFSAWGRAVHDRDLPSWAMYEPETEAPIAGVCRALARKLRLSVVNCCSDGGDQTERHYQLTLGHKLRSGGWSVEGQCWVAVPRGGAR